MRNFVFNFEKFPCEAGYTASTHHSSTWVRELTKEETKLLTLSSGE